MNIYQNLIGPESLLKSNSISTQVVTANPTITVTTKSTQSTSIKTISVETTNMVTKTETTTSSPNYPLVYISGSVSTKSSYNDSISSKHTFQNKAQTDIQKLFLSNPLVVDVKVSITSMTKTEDSHRRKRSIKDIILNFIAVCSIGIAEKDFDIQKIELSFNSTLMNAEIDMFDLFDEESMLSFKSTFETPTVIEVELPSKNEISQKIGLFNFAFYDHLK